MIGVYGIKNIKTGKWYIGSSENVESRFESHKSKLSNQIGYLDSNKDLCDFTFHVLIKLDTITELESWENFYIGRYNSIEEGYNSILARRKKKIVIRPAIINKIKPVEILTPEQLMDHFKISLSEYCILLECGVPHYKLTKNTLRFDLSEVKDWIVNMWQEE